MILIYVYEINIKIQVFINNMKKNSYKNTRTELYLETVCDYINNEYITSSIV